MTSEFRLGLGLSVGLHVALLAGWPGGMEPVAFDVERGPTSVELYFVKPAAPAPVETSVAPPQEPVPAVAEPAQEPPPQSVVTEEHRGAEVEVLPGYLRNPPPVYPRSARERGQEGTVVLEVEVLASGRCGTVNVLRSSGSRLLDDAAVLAVRGWVFRPARRWREPVPFWVEIPVTFRLVDAEGGIER